MNARKRRPASKKPQRWRAWGCVFAMGLVATPIQTLALAHSEPQVRGADSFPISANQAVELFTDSGSSGAGGLTRDLWGDAEEHEAYRRLDRRMARNAADTYRALQALNPTAQDANIEAPRELPSPTKEAIPLPETPLPADKAADEAADEAERIQRLACEPITEGITNEVNSAVDHTVVRQRFLATMGWTAVASHSSDICPTPGAPRSASRDAEKATEVLLDGFRARRLAQSTSARNDQEDRTTLTTTKRTDRQPLRPTPASTSSRTATGKSSAHVPSDSSIRTVSESEATEEAIRPRTVQADFRLEPVSGAGQVRPIEVMVTEIEAEDAIDHEFDDAVEDVTMEVAEGTDRAEREPAVSADEAANDTLPLRLAPPTTFPAPLVPTEPHLTKQRGPTFAGISDDEGDDEGDELRRDSRPTASPTMRQDEGPARPTASRFGEGQSGGSTPPSSSPRWYGVSDEQEPVNVGVTDGPSLVRAGVSDEDQKVRAGVSDRAVLVLERATNRPKPQRAAVSDEPLPARGSASDGTEPVLAGVTDRVTDKVADRVADEVTDRVSDGQEGDLAHAPEPSAAELIIMPAMEVGPSPAATSPEQVSEPQDLALESLASRPLPLLEPQEVDSSENLETSDSEGVMQLDLAAPPRSAGERSPRVARASVSSDDFGEQDSVPVTRLSPRDHLTTHGRVQLELQQSRSVRTRKEILRTETVDPAICDVVQLDSGEISIIGKQAGQTHVRVWGRGKGTSGEVSTNYLVTVGTARQTANRQADQHDRLVARLAQHYPHADLELIVSDDRVVVEGRAGSNQEAVDILSQVRQVWLVPVEDRITVRR